METSVIILEGGKYTLKHENGANLRAERFGGPWRDLKGDGMILAMFNRIEELESKLEKINSKKNWKGCRDCFGSGGKNKSCKSCGGTGKIFEKEQQ